LFVQVLAALVLGIVLGMAAPDFAVGLKILSDAFLKLISMIVAPIVFCVVVHGIAGAGSLRKVGRVGIKAIVYFEVITTIALVLGIALAYIFQPGVGMNIDPRSLDAAALQSYVETASHVKSLYWASTYCTGGTAAGIVLARASWGFCGGARR
jgi:aerobic C4-dicarboxylate transport protein